MALPAADYFSIVDGLGAVCLTILTDDDPDAPELAGGPSIILGNYQQQNIYLEYDLEKERLGFRKQICRWADGFVRTVVVVQKRGLIIIIIIIIIIKFYFILDDYLVIELLASQPARFNVLGVAFWSVTGKLAAAQSHTCLFVLSFIMYEKLSRRVALFESHHSFAFRKYCLTLCAVYYQWAENHHSLFIFYYLLGGNYLLYNK